MEIQQSGLYASYVTSLGWKVIPIGQTQVFLRHFPLIGGLAKIQRCTQLPDPAQVIRLLTEYRVRRLAVEPAYSISQPQFNDWRQKLSVHFRLSHTHYLPTKTLTVDLTPSEEQIFKSFGEAKRRAVRRALKNNLRIYKSTNINELISVKNKSAGFLGFITTYGLDKLWQIFSPKHASILLAYNSNSQLVGGVLLLFWDKTAYYWIAAAAHEGKKLFAPTLLVWEALKLAKRQGASQFDFVGVWDERLPTENKAWLGFTNFKEGFGGEPIYYPYVSKE